MSPFRSRSGGSSIRALIALPALLGKLGKGSGIILGASNAFPKTPARLQRPDLAPAGTRTLNLLDVGRHLADDDIDPPLRAVFIYNHNPIVVHPDQARIQRGLAREDIFYVGIEIAMTESMALCDVILPAATHFEQDDLYAAYGALIDAADFDAWLDLFSKTCSYHIAPRENYERRDEP